MPTKTLLLLSYWGVDDVLTASTVLPHAQVISNMDENIRIVLVTVERAKPAESSIKRSVALGYSHRPIYSKNYPVNLLNKVSDYLIFPKLIQRIAEEEKVTAILAAGTLAGALALLVHQRSGLPFYVAYFEPHAAYMLDTKVWKRYDPRYLFQRKWEQAQAVKAAGLITVSAAFHTQFIQKVGADKGKWLLARNAPQAKQFAFSAASRSKIRSKLGIHNSEVVGIYAGKYGDLYYKEEAFAIYKRCFETITNFRLIILTPQSHAEVVQLLTQHGIDHTKVHIATVPHTEVLHYLSAADFGFATIKSYPSARYCSPVKVGEYWANGLPVLLTEGVGDDSDIIQQEGGGATFNLKQPESLGGALEKIQHILQDPQHREAIPRLAQKYRSPERVLEAYKHFFGDKGEGTT